MIIHIHRVSKEVLGTMLRTIVRISTWENRWRD